MEYNYNVRLQTEGILPPRCYMCDHWHHYQMDYDRCAWLLPIKNRIHARKLQNLTQSQMAKLIGVDINVIKEYETSHKLNPFMLKKLRTFYLSSLAKHLGTTKIKLKLNYRPLEAMHTPENTKWLREYFQNLKDEEKLKFNS